MSQRRELDRSRCRGPRALRRAGLGGLLGARRERKGLPHEDSASWSKIPGNRMEIPELWKSRNPALFASIPPEASVFRLEHRWLGGYEICRVSFACDVTREALFESMKSKWKAAGATSFKGDAVGRSAETSDWATGIHGSGEPGFIATIQFGCTSDQHARGIREMAQSLPSYVPLLGLLEAPEIQPKMMYHSLIVEPPIDGPVHERAGLHLLGRVRADEVGERLRAAGFRPDDEGIWKIDGNQERLQVWEPGEGVHITLNPQNL
jgi:hypothetical protein